MESNNITIAFWNWDGAFLRPEWNSTHAEAVQQLKRLSKNLQQALVVKCIPVFLMSDVKKLFNLIISLSLLYLVLCSNPHFHVVFYMLLVAYHDSFL